MPNYGSKEQLYKDTLTTWIETGCGLWAAPIWKRRDSDLSVLECEVQDAEDEDEPEHKVTLDTVQTGFQRVMSGKVPHLHASYVKLVAGAYATEDAGDIDAEAADIIVQAGIFNDIIYG